MPNGDREGLVPEPIAVVLCDLMRLYQALVSAVSLTAYVMLIVDADKTRISSHPFVGRALFLAET